MLQKRLCKQSRRRTTSLQTMTREYVRADNVALVVTMVIRVVVWRDLCDLAGLAFDHDCMYVCVCVYVRMYVCIHVCMHACMHVCMYVLPLLDCGYMYRCMFLCPCCTLAHTHKIHVHAYIHTCIHTCMCANHTKFVFYGKRHGKPCSTLFFNHIP